MSARLHNQLEPSALTAWFAAHPPEDFVPLEGGGTPAFSADFDLLTTADEGLKHRLARWPGHVRWARWLRIRTGFVGTTVTEYALLPPAPAPSALVAGWLQRWSRDFRLLIVKDLPEHSPLLPEADNARAAAVLHACEDAGFVLVEGQALAYLPITFADSEAWLATLSKSRRQNLRRKLRSREQLRIRRIPTGAAFADDALVDAYYALYEGVHAQSEIHFDKLTRPFFAGLLRDASAAGLVFEYRGAADGALIGWNLCFEHDGKLVDKYIGLAYPQAREANLYFVSWVVNLEYAAERRLTHYVAGWTDPEVKRQLGAQFTFTRHAVYIRNPLLRALGRRFASHFESDRSWHEASA